MVQNNNFVIDMTQEMKNSVIKVPELWQGSKHELWFRNNNQAKGSHGSYAYKKFLENLGYEVRIISDEGDLEYKKTNDQKWIKSEVKAAKSDLKKLNRPKGFITESLWFNQIRPKQSGWDEIVLVGFYPNHVKIWRKSRKDWDDSYRNLTSTNNVLSHKGTEELSAVSLKKNTKIDNFDEWECIHNDQQGERL